MRTKQWHGIVGALLAVGVVLAACSGSGADQNQPERNGRARGGGTEYEPGFVGDREPGGEPVQGGTLDIAVTGAPTGLDPPQSRGLAGGHGGMALAAIYGVLMRYDPKTGHYEPQLAKSLKHNDNYTRWTLGLRAGVEFSDGTPLDARAVKFSIERYIELGGENSSLMERLGLHITIADPLTVVFTLEKSWPNFPYLLAETPGCIVSPAAVKKWGEDFGKHPVGAGPFVLERLAPGEETILEANPNYWREGRPYLDGLRFVQIAEPTAKLDTLDVGGLDASFFSTPDFVAAALEHGYSGYLAVTSFSPLMYINSRPGRPGSDRRVRKAIAFAINPEVIDERAWNGEGLPGKAMFQEFSRWHTKAQPTPYAPEEARKLLSEAERDGYDGKISILYWPANEDIALAIKAMLEAVGFTVNLDVGQTIEDVIRRYRLEYDYDLAITAANIYDSAVYPTLYDEVVAENPSQYRNQHMDALVGELRSAAEYGAKLSILGNIQRLWTETVPYIVLGASPLYIAWQDNVHGVIPTLNTVGLFQNAWIGKS